MQTSCIDLLAKSEIQRVLGDFAQELIQSGLNPEISIRYLIAAFVTNCEYGEYPPITSGYRSPARQVELLRRWNVGDRAGLVVRPSMRSWHMQGLAVDVSPRIAPMAWERFIELMQAMGARWGGDFRTPDPVHFDFPIGNPIDARTLALEQEAGINRGYAA